MGKRVATIAAVLTLVGVAMAGCGSSDSKSSGGGNPAAGGASKHAVASCKQSVSNAPNLKAGIKSDLNKICDKAGAGDEQGARKAARDVCLKIVDSSAPAGAARKQAEKACNAAQTGKVPNY